MKVNDLQYEVGQDADEVTGMDPDTFKNSEHLFEQLVYKFSHKHGGK